MSRLGPKAVCLLLTRELAKAAVRWSHLALPYAIFVGLWLFLNEAPQVKACGVTAAQLDPDNFYGPVATVLNSRRTASDLENVAMGYGLGIAGMRQQAQFGCSAISFVFAASTNALLQSQMVKFPNL